MRIAEVAEKYDISADTLRYYERIGFVKCMRGANVSIEALIEYMQLLDEGDATLEARKQILIEQREAARERLARVQEGLDRLDYKIAHYDELLAGRGGCSVARTCDAK